jgi:hypothetical protein
MLQETDARETDALQPHRHHHKQRQPWRTHLLLGCLMGIFILLAILTVTHVRMYWQVASEYERLNRDLVTRFGRALDDIDAVVESPLGYMVEGAAAGPLRQNATQHQLAQSMQRLLRLLPTIEHMLHNMERFTTIKGPPLPPPPSPPLPPP